VVPVTIVTNAPPGELQAAAPAPETQAAQAEQPAPEAPPEPVPPVPQPSPAPPQPAPAPAKAVEKTKPEPKAKPEQHLDLDALAASVSKLSKPAGGKTASAAKGPPQAATAPETGKGLSAAAQASVSGMKDQVERRWNPNCDVAGGRDVQVSVFFRIDSSGQVTGQVGSQIRSAQNEVSRAAADRAVRAVYAAAPFRNLPRELYGQNFKLNFDAKDACS
jgi:outer membrane biosynthesis protein TonB